MIEHHNELYEKRKEFIGENKLLIEVDEMSDSMVINKYDDKDPMGLHFLDFDGD